MAARSIGLVVSEHVAAGVVEGDRVVGEVRLPCNSDDLLHSMPADELVRLLAVEAASLAAGEPVEAIGFAFPGIIRSGVIQDSPNLPQLKGLE